MTPDPDYTDHSAHVARLRAAAGSDTLGVRTDAELAQLVAADLLEMHDDTGISLDTWPAAREFVERHIGEPITENGA